MAIVSCPECGKKLKIADTSVGKKVKGPCGHVFVADGASSAPAAAPPAPAVAPEKVYVACSECGAKLKVATTSLGKKMKCPKCSAVFVANMPEEAPVKKAPPPPAPVDDLLDEDDVPPPPPAKGKSSKPAVTDDDMDDLMSFAQSDADGGAEDKADDEDLFKNEPVKSRAKRKMDEEAEADEDAPKPKGKGKPADEDEDEAPRPKGKKPPPMADAKPVYPSRLLVSLFVFLLLLIFGALVGAIFFEINIAKEIGLPESKGVRPKMPVNLNAPISPVKKTDKDTKDKGAKDDKSPANSAVNKIEMAKLNGTWIVESASMPGVSLDALKGQKFVIADGVITTPDPLVAPFSIDASKSPKWIDMPTAAKLAAPGIYQLDGDSLQWRTAMPTEVATPDGKKKFVFGERPKSFDEGPGVLIALTREKKQKDKDKVKAGGKLPGAAGPRVVLLGKPPAGIDVDSFFLAIKDDETYSKDWNQTLPSGTKLVHVGMIFAKVGDKTNVKLRLASDSGPLKLAMFLLVGSKKLDGGERWFLECQPESMVFADGAYQVTISIDGKDVALLNWSVSGKGPELDKTTGKAPIDSATSVAMLKKLGADIQETDGKIKAVLFKRKGTDANLALLAPLRDLEEVDLNGCGELNGTGLIHLKGLAKLKKLSLTDTAVTDASLAHVSGVISLEELNIAGTDVTDKGMVHISKLANLRVFIPYGRISDAGLAHMSGLTKMRYLNLLACEKVSDAGLVHLKRMTELEQLHLNGSPITDAGLVHLEGLTKVAKLGLSSTAITDKGLASIGKLAGLRDLDLSRTKIDGSGFGHLKNLKDLHELSVERTMLIDANLTNLKGLESLRFINAARTKVSEGGEKMLKTILPECNLYRG